MDMGGYDDWSLIPPDGGDPVAGICHARGVNATLPAAWLVYWMVAVRCISQREPERRCSYLPSSSAAVSARTRNSSSFMLRMMPVK